MKSKYNLQRRPGEPATKVCSGKYGCHKELPIDNFIIKLQRGNLIRHYQCHECRRKCHRVELKDFRKKHKNDPVSIDKNRNYWRIYYHKNQNKIRNRAKIREDLRTINLSTVYLKHLFRSATKEKFDPNNPDHIKFVQEKKFQVQVKRKIKELQNER